TLVYTAKTHTSGGRENGVSRSSDGRLDVRLSTPGSPRISTNPEQLFAVGRSACFASAIADAAGKKKISLPAGVAIDAEVDLNLVDGGTCSVRGSISVWPASNAKPPGLWWMKRIRFVRTPKQLAETLISRSTWSERTPWPLQSKSTEARTASMSITIRRSSGCCATCSA